MHSVFICTFFWKINYLFIFRILWESSRGEGAMIKRTCHIMSGWTLFSMNLMLSLCPSCRLLLSYKGSQEMVSWAMLSIFTCAVSLHVQLYFNSSNIFHSLVDVVSSWKWTFAHNFYKHWAKVNIHWLEPAQITTYNLFHIIEFCKCFANWDMH